MQKCLCLKLLNFQQLCNFDPHKNNQPCKLHHSALYHFLIKIQWINNPRFSFLPAARAAQERRMAAFRPHATRSEDQPSGTRRGGPGLWDVAPQIGRPLYSHTSQPESTLTDRCMPVCLGQLLIAERPVLFLRLGIYICSWVVGTKTLGDLLKLFLILAQKFWNFGDIPAQRITTDLSYWCIGNTTVCV